MGDSFSGRRTIGWICKECRGDKVMIVHVELGSGRGGGQGGGCGSMETGLKRRCGAGICGPFPHQPGGNRNQRSYHTAVAN